LEKRLRPHPVGWINALTAEVVPTKLRDGGREWGSRTLSRQELTGPAFHRRYSAPASSGPMIGGNLVAAY
jgi:hypothetical protein